MLGYKFSQYFNSYRDEILIMLFSQIRLGSTIIKINYLVILIIANIIIHNIMDNYSNNSQQQSDIYSIQPEKPKNRNKIVHKGLCLNSDFSGGNLHSASFKDQIVLEGKLALLIQFFGNSDTNSDIRDKCWFYFTLSGIKQSRNLKYSFILFRFKNANIYKKFVRERKFRPYVVMRENRDKSANEWKIIYLSKITQPVQNQPFQAEFVYKIQPGIDKVSFASNLPYNLADFQAASRKIIDFLDTTRNSMIYYHREIIAESVDGHPVYMLTITSTKNVSTYNQEQPEIWPYKGQRPYLLRNKPEIVFTARVHPSEVSSSFCIEGIIQNLVRNPKLQFLLSAFIFRVIPMINPDGVENGHYRLDNYSQNLNRFYGHSDPTKTPSIYAVQKLLTNLRQKSKLFLFLDIHGHNSPKPSFIFGNYSQKFQRSLENRTFARIMEALSGESFSFLQCEFSKKNMSVKQKYDEHSKQASARVFAYQGNCSAENNQPRSETYVDHSYTLEVHPYVMYQSNGQTSNLSKQSLENGSPPLIKEKLQIPNPSYIDIVREYKKIGQNILVAILEILGANSYYKLAQNQNGQAIRRKCLKQLIKLPQFYERFKKQRERERQINREFYQRYYKNWNVIQSYKEYYKNNSQVIDSSRKEKVAQCPIHQYFMQQLGKRDSIKRISPLRIESSLIKSKSKQIIYKKQKSQVLLIGEKEQFDSKTLNNYEITPEKKLSKSEEAQLDQILEKSSKQDQISYTFMENKMLEKIEKFYMNSPIRNSPRLVNYTPTFNSQKRNIKSGELQNIGELEKRAKRLIFRHKTEMQTKEMSHQKNKKNLLKVELGSLEKSIQRNNLSSQKYLFENQSPFGRNLEPLSKKKSKQMRMKAEDYKDNKQKLSNILFKNNNIKELRQEKKIRIISTQNPKIQQLLRRVSLNKNEQKNSGFEDDDLIPQMNRLKGTKTILSNLILMKSKSKIAKGLSNTEKQDIIHSISNNCVVYDTNNTLIPLMHQSKAFEGVADFSDGASIVKAGLQGSYRSIGPIPKQEITSRDSEMRQITSLQAFKKNNHQFLEKAKNEILEKKKIFKSIER